MESEASRSAADTLRGELRASQINALALEARIALLTLQLAHAQEDRARAESSREEAREEYRTLRGKYETVRDKYEGLRRVGTAQVKRKAEEGEGCHSPQEHDALQEGELRSMMSTDSLTSSIGYPDSSPTFPPPPAQMERDPRKRIKLDPRPSTSASAPTAPPMRPSQSAPSVSTHAAHAPAQTPTPNSTPPTRSILLPASADGSFAHAPPNGAPFSASQPQNQPQHQPYHHKPAASAPFQLARPPYISTGTGTGAKGPGAGVGANANANRNRSASECGRAGRGASASANTTNAGV
ncbi:hypothetical protein B0H15DRAFT_928553 [Mycena belliarum]|uniref:Uncharacterized protein n=1 Tax=Mycena belliarum TaxID=1033014 RepID=A0AAD6XUR8_9AGAR|nr:hypothetical protein B0H15DRAFT_928553 [Mycena belliae]